MELQKVFATLCGIDMLNNFTKALNRIGAPTRRRKGGLEDSPLKFVILIDDEQGRALSGGATSVHGQSLPPAVSEGPHHPLRDPEVSSSLTVQGQEVLQVTGPPRGYETAH